MSFTTMTKIQIRERAKRERNRLQAFGVMQCRGTKPREFRQPTGVPGWKPMPRPKLQDLDLLGRLTRMFDWLRPKRPPEKIDKV